MKSEITYEGFYAPIWWCHGFQHECTKVSDWSQKFNKFTADKFFSDFDEIEEESEFDDDDIYYYQVSSHLNLKLLLVKIIQDIL